MCNIIGVSRSIFKNESETTIYESVIIISFMKLKREKTTHKRETVHRLSNPLLYPLRKRVRVVNFFYCIFNYLAILLQNRLRMVDLLGLLALQKQQEHYHHFVSYPIPHMSTSFIFFAVAPCFVCHLKHIVCHCLISTLHL